MNYHLRRLLSALEDVMKGQKKKVGLYNHSDYIVLHPTDGKIRVAYVSKQELENLDRDDMLVVNKERVCMEITEAAKGFYNQVLSLNPELSDDEDMKELKRSLDRVEGFEISDDL